MGVKLDLNTRIDDIPAAMAEDGYEACFVAVGAHLAKRAEIATDAPEAIVDAVAFLRAMAIEAKPPKLGRRVAVYGGGNTAIDVARTALRQGAEEVRIVYRRTRERMPAHDFEIAEALEEGVILQELRTITGFFAGKLTIEAMTLDQSGWPQPTGQTETVAVDNVVLALGQDADLAPVSRLSGIALGKDQRIVVDADFRTGHVGVYAGGDMVPGERTVTVAIGHGKRAARAIDAALRGVPLEPNADVEKASFERMHLWYYNKIPAAVLPMRVPEERSRSFEEVVSGLAETVVRSESARCLSCGSCLECDNCVVLCPYRAVAKRGPGEGFQIDQAVCKVCGLCVVECPCGSLQLVNEEHDVADVMTR
jgi:Pyruvate/2-oxoacid:ferredoxin oxidoreductase delta subunit